MRTHQTLILLLTLVALGHESANAGIARFDPKVFDRMSVEERTQFLTTGLRLRESRMENFSYDLTERISRFRPTDTSPKPFEVNEISLKVSGKENWLHIKRVNKGKGTIDFVASWDGSTRRALYHYPDGSTPKGVIADSELESLQEIHFNGLIGYRVLALERPDWIYLPSRADWIEHEISLTKDPVEIGSEVDVKTGDALIRIKIYDGSFQGDYTVLWFDPIRDFMLVKEDHLDVRRVGDNFGYRRSEITESKEVDGLWVPMSAVQRRATSQCQKDGEFTSHEYDVSRFALGDVRQKALHIAFPLGTRVVDSIEHVAYDVGENGAKRFVPLADRQTGVVTVGKEEPFQNPQPPFPASRQWVWSTVMAVAVAAVTTAAAILLLRQRRKASAAAN